jgi:hypothetical protein
VRIVVLSHDVVILTWDDCATTTNSLGVRIRLFTLVGGMCLSLVVFLAAF